MDSSQVINVAYVLVVVSVIGKFNPAVKDFITSEFIMFCVFTLFMYKRNKNILVSMSVSFFGVVLLSLLMTEDVMEKVREKFQSLTGIDVKLGCSEITVKDLLDKFEGDENALKKAMVENNVPHNLPLTDENAPVIATYLVAGTVDTINGNCNNFYSDATNEFKI